MKSIAPASERPAQEWNLTIGPDLLLYITIHLLAAFALLKGITPQALTILAATYFIRIFGQGMSYHRYFAHRSFKTSRVMQFILAFWGILSLQGGVLWWADTHRQHHHRADKPADLHSPRHQGFWYSHWGWFHNKSNKGTNFENVSDLARYPELVWVNSAAVYNSITALYGLSLLVTLGWEGFLWGFCVSTVCQWHTVHWIQSMSHSMGGYRHFETSDDSRNHWLLGIVSLGEFHNNHHYRPSSARQGYSWWEVDIVYLGLLVLRALGLVWDLNDSLHRSSS